VHVADLCRKHGPSSLTFYKSKAKCGGLDVSEAVTPPYTGRLRPICSRPTS